MQVGDHVLFRFDRQSRSAERQRSGYTLPLHLGQVTRVLTPDKVQVWWMFSEAWNRRWILWRDPTTKQAYKEVMQSSQILQDTHGMAAKLMFVSRKKQMMLDKPSLALIEEILGVDEYSTGVD